MVRRCATCLRTLFLLAIASAPALASRAADPLPRRAWLGAALEAAENGIRVREVMPGSTAEAAGLQPGDVIVALNQNKASTLPAFIATLRTLHGGQEIALGVLRDQDPLNFKVTLKEWPREQATETYSVEYGQVESAGGQLRTITFVPKNANDAPAKRPALLIIQGLGAATLDNPTPGQAIDQPTGMAVYRTISDSLAREGYVVMCVDKSGCGDSEGDPRQLDFNTELDGYRQALKQLAARPDVDANNLSIFGHSMGGVFGPMLAGEIPLRGVAVYGTLVKTWTEYLAENSRRQNLLAGADPAEYDRMARRLEKFNYEYLVNKKSPEQVVKEHSDLTGIEPEISVQNDQVFGRHFSFFQQLYDVNLPEAWAKHHGHVLALWGEAEFVSGRDDHELIAAIANVFDPGQGTFAVVAQSDHGFGRAKDPADALVLMSQPPAPGTSRFNPEIIKVLRDWLQKTRAS